MWKIPPMDNSTYGKLPLWKIPPVDKSAISQKLKIWTIWKLIFHSIRHIPYLSYKFYSFWKKKLLSQTFIQLTKKNWWGSSLLMPPTGAVPPDPACFRIEDLSQNRLASTAYFVKPLHVVSVVGALIGGIFHMWNCPWVELSIDGIVHRWNCP